MYSNLPLLYQHMFLCVNKSTHFNWAVNRKNNNNGKNVIGGTIKEDYYTISFYLYSSEVISLGSFVSKRLNLYFEQL